VQIRLFFVTAVVLLYCKIDTAHCEFFFLAKVIRRLHVSDSIEVINKIQFSPQQFHKFPSSIWENDNKHVIFGMWIAKQGPLFPHYNISVCCTPMYNDQYYIIQ
jgi:hypothetical protein